MYADIYKKKKQKNLMNNLIEDKRVERQSDGS